MKDVLGGILDYITTALRDGYKLGWCAVGGFLRYQSIFFLHLRFL